MRHPGTVPSGLSERLDDALARLSPYQRALIELSLRRGISDDEIAGLLRIDPVAVERRRQNALHRLAGDLDAAAASDLADLLTEGWGNGDAPSDNNTPVVTSGAPGVTPARERSRRRVRPVLLVALLAAAAAAAAVPALSGGGEKTTHPAAPVRPTPAPPHHSAKQHPVAPAKSRAHPRSTANSTGVIGCHMYASSPTVLISSARNMSCSNAAREMKPYRRPIYRRFQTPHRFFCFSVSGGAIGGQWRCVRAAEAFRFEYGG
jgi:sigma-70-like protein